MYLSTFGTHCCPHLRGNGEVGEASAPTKPSEGQAVGVEGREPRAGVGQGGAAAESPSWAAWRPFTHPPGEQGRGAQGGRGQASRPTGATQERTGAAGARPVLPASMLSRTLVFLGLCLSFLLFLCVCTSLSISHFLLEFLFSCLFPPLPSLYSLRGAAPIRS